MMNFFWLFFSPDRNMQVAKSPKNKPNGSDLNHPKLPLIITGNDMENRSDAINPAEVELKDLTNAKIIMDVEEPITTGNNIR